MTQSTNSITSVASAIVIVCLLATPLLGQPDLERKFRAPSLGGVPDQYIVIFKGGATRGPHEAEGRPTSGELARELAAAHGGEVALEWSHGLRGGLLIISEAGARALARNPKVAYVEQNFELSVGTIDNCDSFFQGIAPETQDPIFKRNITSPQPIQCDDPDPRNALRSCIDNWGLDRIDQFSNNRDANYGFTATGRSSATQVHVYLIDTGLSKQANPHMDFDDLKAVGVRIKEGVNATVPAGHSLRSFTDDCFPNSHGTHVGGIAASNTFGVAKEVWLHPVVFIDWCNSAGNSLDSTAAAVIEGLEWIILKHNNASGHIGPAVASFSGGNSTDPEWHCQALIDEIGNLNDAGVLFIQSAGNQSMDACPWSLGGESGLEDGLLLVGGADEESPSGFVQTVRWLREEDDPSDNPNPGGRALCSELGDCGSNFGTCVDLWAPAAHVISTGSEAPDQVCRLSGTSMAAPHAAGVAALYLEKYPNAPPAEVKQALQGMASCGPLRAGSDDYSIQAGSPNLMLRNAVGDGINQRPEAHDDHLWVFQSTDYDFDTPELRANDFDPDGDSLSYGCTVVGPEHGTLSIRGIGAGDIAYTYTPDPGYTGPDEFVYRVVDPSEAGDQAKVRITVTSGGAVTMGEVGQVNVDHNPKTVMLTRTYEDPVVLAQPASFNGSHVAVVRITDVQPDRFTLFIHEAPNHDGSHVTETVNYVVLEAGVWTLADGTLIEVGRQYTNTHLGVGPDTWASIGFRTSFPVVPAILSQVQTNRDPRWVMTRQKSAATWGFSMTLQQDDASTVHHDFELVGWAAIEPGQGSWSGLAYEGASTADAVTHNWFTIGFAQSFAQPPRFLAAVATTDGGDSAHPRYQSPTTTSVQVKVEEDTTADSEVNHTSEVVSYLVLGGSGTLSASPTS